MCISSCNWNEWLKMKDLKLKDSLDRPMVCMYSSLRGFVLKSVTVICK